jgi:tetratricopeptide (TPR) repeat protein
MALNAYDACPCGSGKKLKWCCAPYFDQIELALVQQQEGQHESSVKTMEHLTRTHGDKPQVWGYYSNILFAEGKTEEAEEAINKAFALQPDFPMGYLLRGMFRQSEGEIIGALMLFRKAAEAYSPDALDQLAQVHEMIARIELTLNRPVACRASLERAVHFQPADQELREQFEGLFGEHSRLPACGRRRYAFRPMTRQLPAAASESGKLSDARKAFEQLTREVPDDPAAWFNLGLVRAWLGEQPAAVEALNKSVELEADDGRAEEAAALAEVLRCAQGMENDADYLEHRVFMPIRDAEAVRALLQAWDQEGRMIAAQADPQGQFFSALVVEELPSLLETGTKMARVTANLNIVGGLLRLWHPVKESVEKVAREVRDRLNLAVGEPTFGTGPIQFGDVALEALAYPVRTSAVVDAEQKLRDFAANYFETVWPHQPLRSLGGAGPMDAAGSTVMRKRVLGVVKFVEDCVRGAAPRKKAGEVVEAIDVYDFERLRHKLGIDERRTAPAPVPQAAPVQQPAPAAVVHVIPAPAPKKPVSDVPRAPDFAAMNAAELAGLPRDSLPAGELEDAMRAAIKLDARELAVAFAKAGVAKPAGGAKPDRYPFYATLMTGAQSEGHTADALRYADEGAKYDTEHNAGKRANEYGLRKAALYAKTGNADAAAAEFDAILDRNPDEGNLYVKAAEAMLGAKRGDKAAYFAEKGLAKARANGNRDLEGACRELADAAKRYK